MKTLDEVIKAVEHCISELGCDDCPFRNEPDCMIREDALHYLKEYQTTQIAYMTAMADLEDNPALTWDELLVMIGKPVWVESGIGSEWYLVGGRHSDDCIKFTDVKGGIALGEMKNCGKTWQAYRKERK